MVDWMDATSGDPAADVCRSFVLMSSRGGDIGERYVDCYVRTAGIDRSAVFAWLPFVAAARLAENAAEETGALMEMVGDV